MKWKITKSSLKFLLGVYFQSLNNYELHDFFYPQIKNLFCSFQGHLSACYQVKFLRTSIPFFICIHGFQVSINIKTSLLCFLRSGVISKISLNQENCNIFKKNHRKSSKQGEGKIIKRLRWALNIWLRLDDTQGSLTTVWNYSRYTLKLNKK